MDFLFRYATNVYGQTVLLGASWDLFWWFVGAGGVFIVLNFGWTAIGARAAWPPRGGGEAGGDRLTRHALPDRLYHWTMAAAVLTLLFTAFAPIEGLKFEWVTTHWIAGIVLAILVVYHVVRAVLWQDFWAMMIGAGDLRDFWRAVARTTGQGGPPPDKPGKYELLQKLYHWTIAALVLALVATGLLMLLKIDTPLWRRDPYWFADDTWGVIYAVHGLCAMAAVALVLIHIYFAVRPDKLWVTRSMILGWITREDYLDHHDPQRWKI